MGEVDINDDLYLYFPKDKEEREEIITNINDLILIDQIKSPLKEEDINQIKNTIAPFGYYLRKYIATGSEGSVYAGLKKGNECNGYKQVAIKIILNKNQKEIEEEITIMQLFKQSTNIINLIENFEISEKIYVFVFPLCQSSLHDQLAKQFDHKLRLNILIFTFLSLIDALIQLRSKKVLNLDIKEQNIGITKLEQILILDFGTALQYNPNCTIKLKGFTQSRAAEEVRRNEKMNIGFGSDLFSVAKVLLELLKVYAGLNEHCNVYKELQEMVETQMMEEDVQKRKDCKYFHKKVISILITNGCQQFLECYFNSINQMLEQDPFDKNVDTHFCLKIQIYFAKTKLKILESSQSNQTEKILDTHTTLGKLYQKIGKYQIALDHLSKVKQNSELLFYGLSLKNIGDPRKASKYFKDLLVTLKQQFSGNHVEIARCLSYRGQCYYDLGNYEKSQIRLNESLKMFEELSNNYESEIATTENYLGLCYLSNAKKEEAEFFLKKSFQKIQQLYQSNHPDKAASHNSQGVYYLSLGDYKNAISYFQQSHIMLQELFNGNHPQIAYLQNNISLCFIKQGEHKMAFSYQLSSYQLSYKMFGPYDHPDIANCLNNLGLFFTDFGNKISLTDIKDSQKRYKILSIEDHLHIVTLLGNLVQAYKDNNNDYNNQIALDYLNNSLGMYQRLYKGDHPHIATCLHNVGYWYKDNHDHEQALSFLEQSLIMRKKLFNPNHPIILSTLTCIDNIKNSNQIYS